MCDYLHTYLSLNSILYYISSITLLSYHCLHRNVAKQWWHPRNSHLGLLEFHIPHPPQDLLPHELASLLSQLLLSPAKNKTDTSNHPKVTNVKDTYAVA